jgi:uncharacterized protein (TIGR02996 family)
MTTEDDFQAALDRQPDDWQTRLVFADWLQEHNDPRADGYRALGILNRYVTVYAESYQDYPWFCYSHLPRIDGPSLPDDWFDLLTGGIQTVAGVPTSPKDLFSSEWLDWPSRREAEDAAAEAFTKLPAARRAELLTVAV